MDQYKYNVVVEKFAERHFIKSFAKKYKSEWTKLVREQFKDVEEIFRLR